MTHLNMFFLRNIHLHVRAVWLLLPYLNPTFILNVQVRQKYPDLTNSQLLYIPIEAGHNLVFFLCDFSVEGCTYKAGACPLPRQCWVSNGDEYTIKICILILDINGRNRNQSANAGPIMRFVKGRL